MANQGDSPTNAQRAAPETGRDHWLRAGRILNAGRQPRLWFPRHRSINTTPAREMDQVASARVEEWWKPLAHPHHAQSPAAESAIARLFQLSKFDVVMMPGDQLAEGDFAGTLGATKPDNIALES